MNTRLLRLGGVPEHFNYPWHLAMESDELADLDLSWEDQPGGTGEMLAKLAAAELDVVSILTEGSISAIDKGLAVTLVQVYVSTPLQWGIFVPGQSDYHSVSELAGARIAISRFNSGSHLMPFILAARDGWEIRDEQFVVVGGLTGAIESFTEGHSELFLWEQHMTRPLVESGQFRQIGVIESPWPSFVLAVRDEVLAARTTEVGRVIDAVVSHAVGLSDQPNILQRIGDHYGLQLETVRSWMDETSFEPRSSMDRSIFTTVLETLNNAGFS